MLLRSELAVPVQRYGGEVIGQFAAVTAERNEPRAVTLFFFGIGIIHLLTSQSGIVSKYYDILME